MNQTYTVKPGDTLWGISNQFGVSVMDLANINNVNANNLQIGMILTIPSSSGTNPDNMFMYTVKKGDTLYKIANTYNTTVDEIIKLNNLTSNNLSIGQILRIPEKYTNYGEESLPDFINYTVKKGDSLYSISKNNNVDIDTIKKDNNLTNNNLSIGQVLKIRVESEEIEECFGEEYTPVDTSITYTVKKGDNLYDIARKYNTSVDNIKRLNNLNSNLLSIGQILKIPSESSSSNVYTVVKGDSLYSIARKFNTSVDSLKRKNNLINNNLSIGQKLII
ncbi:MAG: LysM peptidoglycan-binding domain-containing protein [Bacilli bacterium]|nr:LysM peptidoglycan-binding domain-containing protein [Bacilli bacterium]